MNKEITLESVKTPNKYNGGSNFTAHSRTLETLIKQGKNNNNVLVYEVPDYCIAIDWLELFCESKELSEYIQSLCLSESEPESEFSFNKNISFIYSGHGTKLFRHLLTLRIDDIPFAELQVLPRKEVGVMSTNTIMVKIMNYHLYRIGWTSNLISILNILNIKVLNITRLDIAVDNVNHIKKFMIDYLRQDADNMQFIYAGKSEISYKKMNGFLNFESIQIGSGASDKHISIYNKANEIKRSNKDYIRTFWENNLLNFSDTEVYRVELRLKSKSLKEVQGLSIEDLEKTEILIELFNKMSLSLLDFRIKDNNNISRCTPITLIQLEGSSSILNIGKVKYIPNDVYKAKLSVHLCYKLLAGSNIGYAERHITTQSLRFYIQKYNLRKWFENKKIIWCELYGYVKVSV